MDSYPLDRVRRLLRLSIQVAANHRADQMVYPSPENAERMERSMKVVKAYESELRRRGEIA